MSQPPSADGALLGFVTVTQTEEWGYTGGYLIINDTAKPVEFHCTAPVRITPAQQILYGPTLRPVLFGEQIGRALIEKSRRVPACVCTDRVEVLAVRPLITVPVVLVQPQNNSQSSDSQLCDSGTPNDWILGWKLGVWRSLGDCCVRALERFEQDSQKLAEWLNERDWGMDLSEPFERVREALNEAGRMATNGIAAR